MIYISLCTIFLFPPPSLSILPLENRESILATMKSCRHFFLQTVPNKMKMRKKKKEMEVDDDDDDSSIKTLAESLTSTQLSDDAASAQQQQFAQQVIFDLIEHF